MVSHRRLLAAFASVAFVTVYAGPGALDLGAKPAFAKNDDGNGGGNGNGRGSNRGSSPTVTQTVTTNGSGKSAGSGKPAGAPGQAAKTKDVAPTLATVVVPPKPNLAPATSGKPKGLDAQIASLHAVNANLQAFIHASPNSQVGQIAAYAKAEVTVQVATAAQVAAQAAFT